MPIRTRLAGILVLCLLAAPAIAQSPQVKLVTNKGEIVIALDAQQAPKSVENFLGYVDAGFYDGTIFHRVIPGFMIQGGGLDATLNKKPTRDPIENEAANGLKNARGSVAMARTGAPHSATAQFFINLSDNGFLDYPGRDGWGYAVFGQVTQGMDVVDAIAAVPTGVQNRRRDVPTETIVIESATRLP
ncbi:MAG: peptidylprolyl isomerase [Gammaproteobacteria bacterium]|nr:peptidylprolyl isomerase [Gammaproteobacteria bacterium]